MHALSQHVPEFLELYGNINCFNQQGLEKYNDQCSKDYFRSSNHRNIEALRQMLLKKTRMQLLETMGVARMKNTYSCQNCNMTGHSSKSCINPCVMCSSPCFCAHLVKVNGKWEPVCKESTNFECVFNSIVD